MLIAEPVVVRLPDLAATPSTRSRVRAVVALVRPEHWPKNFVIVPLALLALPTWSRGTVARLGWVVLAFTLAAATVYVVNDILDRHRDRLHPVKRLRPVASGEVSVGAACGYAALLGLLVAGVLAVGPARAGWPIVIYLVVNGIYSTRLKHVPLIDVFIVASGFVLRLMAGAVAVSAPLSGWLILTVLCVCLLFGLGKRRHELVTLTAGCTSSGHRPSLRSCSVQLLDYLALLSAGLAVMSFMSYLSSDAVVDTFGQIALILSAPLALFATFRYLQLLVVHERGGDPVRLLVRDRLLVINCLCWAACLAVAYLATTQPGLVAAVTPGR